MHSAIVFASVLAVAAAAPQLVYSGIPAGLPLGVTSSQFHAQDELGQYSYGYSGGPSAKTESRDAAGNVRGSYSYIDGNGITQTAHYVADPVNGFRVGATNLPIGPAPVAPVVTAAYAAPAAVAYAARPVFTGVPLPVRDTPEVAAAKIAHAQAHAEALIRSA